jgi:hypothetical protein
MARMEQECKLHSRDNSTALLYEVVFADIPKDSGSGRVDFGTPGRGQFSGRGNLKDNGKKELKTNRLLVLITGLALFLTAGYYFYPAFKKPDNLSSPKVARQSKPSKNKPSSADSIQRPWPGRPPSLGAPLRRINDSITDGSKKIVEEKKPVKDSTHKGKELLQKKRKENRILPGSKPETDTLKKNINSVEV